MYDVTYDDILTRMLSEVPDKFDKREGSVIFDALSPAALEFQNLYTELNRLTAEAYGDTASREFLIRRCKERGIIPYKATNAVLKGEFAPADIDVTNRRFNIEDLNYIALEKIKDGEYKMQCETVGVAGNLKLGTATPIDYIPGLESAKLVEILIPGEDEEETEALRKRYFASFTTKAFGGNRQDYIEKVGAIPGVGGVKLDVVWFNGVRPADYTPPDGTRQWIRDLDATTPQEIKKWLNLMYETRYANGFNIQVTVVDSDFNPVSEDFKNNIQKKLDPYEQAGEGLGLMPIGHLVVVKSAVAVPIKVNTTITFKDGCGWETLQSSINEVVSDYLYELGKTWADNDNLMVYKSQIESRILDVEGVLDVQNTKINEKEENLVLGKYEIPTFESVNGGADG